MALWGMNDALTSSGTVQIYANGLVSGTSTAFTSQAIVGNFIKVANTDYMIISITNDTTAQVVGQFHNTTVTAVSSGTSYTLSNKPKYQLMDGDYNIADNTKAWYNVNQYKNFSNTTYGANTLEVTVSNGAVREVVWGSYGSGYSANATVTVTTNNGYETVAATANAQSNATGRIAAINWSNNGVGYTLPPTLTISAPTPIYFNGNVTSGNVSGSVTLGNATSNSAGFYLDNGWISLGTTNTAFWANGDVATYIVQAGNTAIGGLTNNTPYYVYTINSSAIALYTINAGVASYINLASVGTGPQANHSFTGQTAVAAPILSGVKEHTHSGWVKRTVGFGGRAGRVYYETMVASGTIAADPNNSNVFPNA